MLIPVHGRLQARQLPFPINLYISMLHNRMAVALGLNSLFIRSCVSLVGSSKLVSTDYATIGESFVFGSSDEMLADNKRVADESWV